MKVFFVSYFLHNKENDGWAYKVVNKYTSEPAARKAYHSELSSYIDSKVYDQVAVMLTDSFGNKIVSEYWSAPAEQSPAEQAPAE